MPPVRTARTVTAVFLSLCLAVAWRFVIPDAARAAVCDPGRMPYMYINPNWGFAGAGVAPGQSKPLYIRSTILEMDAFVQPGSVVSAWVMLDLQSSGHYAQIGWWHVYGFARSTFDQYIDDSGVMQTDGDWFIYSPGSQIKYEVRATNTGTAFLSNNHQWLLAGNTTFTPNVADYYGEVHNHDDQMPGSVSSPETFGSTQYSRDLRTWTSVTSNGYVTDSTIYDSTKLSAGNYKIYDRDCL